MADEDKNKEKENAEKTPAAAASKPRLGTLNSMEADFISDKIPSGYAKSVDATFQGILKKAYGRNIINSSQEFIGVVMRVIPKPYSLTPKLGPYFKILAHEAQKQGVEFALQSAQQLVLVQVRVPELDSMIPDPPIYDLNLQLSNKMPDQLTEEEKASIELIERHGTFVGWGAEAGTIPSVGSYVRVAYDNVNNRTGGRYLGIVMTPDGVIPSIGRIAADAFGACNGDLADHPTGIPRGSFSGVVPVTPAATEKHKLEKKLARLKRKIEGKDTAGNVVEPPLEQATKDKLAERVKEVEAELAALPPDENAGEEKTDPPPPPPPQNNCVQLMGGGFGSPGPVSVGANGMMGDPGSTAWSNRAKQKKVRWTPTGQILQNGEIENSGLLAHDPKSGAKLLKPAMADFKRLSAAYEKKFPGKVLKGSGYRTYASQVNVRMIRLLGDRANCSNQKASRKAKSDYGEGRGELNDKCQFVGMAATPGTSNHGWGAAVDIKRSDSGWTGGKKGNSPEFQWINKFAHKYNFVFGVTNEHWHIDWMLFGSNIEQVQGKKPRSAQVAWTKKGQSDETITLT